MTDEQVQGSRKRCQTQTHKPHLKCIYNTGTGDGHPTDAKVRKERIHVLNGFSVVRGLPFLTRAIKFNKLPEYPTHNPQNTDQSSKTLVQH